MNIKDIKFREDLYPRFEPSQSTIKKYSESIDQLPPIKIDQHNILIDGFHRWKAHETVGETEIKVDIVTVKSEAELKQLAYRYNSHHGLQLTGEEKQRYAIEMIEISDIKELSEILSVSESVITKWTKNKRDDLEKIRNKQILEMYLHGNETQQSVADAFDLTQNAIKDILKHFSKITETFKNPFLYNIWNSNKGNDTEHFGSFPIMFMENLLHYHSEPMDIVFDPFAGDGTTVDACKKMMRRYYCSDLEVKPGREKDIYFHDITTGIPEDLKKPDLVFLDPPYWKQANGKYIEHENQLGNIESLEDFNGVIQSILDNIRKWKVNKIAIVIQPTQYINDFEFTDHIFDFHTMLSKWYKIEGRYILPYSTQQYNAQMVEKAKEENKCLVLNRDLIVWKIK